MRRHKAALRRPLLPDLAECQIKASNNNKFREKQP